MPFAPAGSSDVLARLLQSPLQQALGQTVIVENRAGAGANIGMVEAARRKLAQHGFDNVRVDCGDGARGFGEGAYDVIVLTGSTPVLPERFVEQLG